jgi:hypothetical protein
LALHSRDLTDIVWVKLNVTAAKTAIGADGVASGATTLTASAASGIVLQTIISASSARIFSAYVRRRTGTGTVEITQDNGTTWTAITLTDSYQRFSSPTGTITNPIFGFRILTSGDEIDVDFTQQETGSYATSYIPTTTASVTRLADAPIKTGISSLIGQFEGTLYVELNANRTGLNQIIELGDGTSANRVNLRLASTNVFRLVIVQASAVVFDESSSATFAQGQNIKMAAAYKSGAVTQVFVNGVSVLTGTAGSITGSLSGIFNGQNGGTLNLMNSPVKAILVFPTALTNAELQSLTAL